MKTFKMCLIFLLSSFYLLNAQEKTFDHKIIAGYNIGASAPFPIPEEVRSIDAYFPQFTPQLGYSINYNYSNNWGFASGIMIDLKGMKVKTKVKYMHINVIMNDEDKLSLEGYFVGRNETEMRSANITVPLYLTYKPNVNWIFSLGGYVSYRYNAQFKGKVWDGYLRETGEDGKLTGQKIIFDDGKEASFDFSDDIRYFDLGLSAMFERKINHKFGIYGKISWGIPSIFSSDFKTFSYKLHDIYGTLGLTYTISN